MATLETWNGRTASQTDAESPLDTTLMDGIRKDLDHLRQVLYGNNEGSGTYYTPAWGHKHNGTDSALVTSVADNAITTAKIQNAAVDVYKLKFTDGNLVFNSGTAPGTYYAQLLSGYSHTPYLFIENTLAGGTTPTVQLDVKTTPQSLAGTYIQAELTLVNSITTGNGSVRWSYHAS